MISRFKECLLKGWRKVTSIFKVRLEVTGEYEVIGVSEEFLQKGLVYRYSNIPTTQQHLERVSQRVGVPVNSFLLKESGFPEMKSLGKFKGALGGRGVT